MQTTPRNTATYSIHAYPAHLINPISLRRGLRATIRPVLPQDAPLEQRFVASLSQAARINRFHGNLCGLSEKVAAQITCIDYVSQMGFVVTLPEGDDEVVIADACYVLSDDGDTAEFAIAVSDAWQRQGLGSQLIEALCNAARRGGARWLYGEVLAANASMIGLMIRCGFTVRPHPGDETLVRVERSVYAPIKARRAARRPNRLLAALNHALPRWLQRVKGEAAQAIPSGRSYERQLFGRVM